MKRGTDLRDAYVMHADPFDPRCPSRRVIDRIGDRWSVLVILVLKNGTQRYGDLARTIGGVSQKMLTQTLRGLERDGIVTRTVYAEVPPKVEYDLTDLGRSLLGPVESLTEWATTHMGEVGKARAGYDRR
ncbi:MAG: winged helix-turn-helix transcriptional regulator [Nocardioides sp.]